MIDQEIQMAVIYKLQNNTTIRCGQRYNESNDEEDFWIGLGVFGDARRRQE